MSDIAGIGYVDGPTDDERAELVALGRERTDLLRRAQALDAELSANGKRMSPDVRAGIIELKNGILRQRFAVNAKIKDRARVIDARKRGALLGALAGASPTALLKEGTRRAGVLESLYFALVRHLDAGGEHGDDFDWRLPVRKAMRTLEQMGGDGQSEPRPWDDAIDGPTRR